jgi:hypothetical protein
MIVHQRLQIAKLMRQLYGQHSERTVRLIDQMELGLEELESSKLPPRVPWPGPRMWWPSPASARRASPSPTIYRASVWSSRARPLACAAAARGYANWARTSPRRWR